MAHSIEGAKGIDLPNPSKLPALIIRSPERPRTPTGSSVLDEGSIEEYGRTYHHYKPDTYVMPNDADEQNRLDLQHHVQKLLLDGELYRAPLHNPRNILDMGTGTGIWAIQFAEQHPESHVIGSDLSLIQPKDMAPNVTFVREDADGDEWTFDRSFDYIHARAFCGFVTNMRKILRRAYEHLEPGGWVELQEFTHEILPADPARPIEKTALKTMTRAFCASMVKQGRDPYIMPHLARLVREAGFVGVVEDVQHLPIGAWAAEEKYREIGRWQGVNFLTGLPALTKGIMQSGLTEGQVAHLVEQARAEVSSGEMFAEMNYYTVYGQRPPE